MSGSLASRQGDPEALARFEMTTGIKRADLDVVASLPLFANLERAILLDLLSIASVRTFPRHTVLFLQDEPASRFYVVLEGWVRLYRETADGHESVIGVFARGESFAEAAIFQNKLYPVSSAAVSDARLLVIPADPFLRQLRRNPDLCLNMITSMSMHLHRLVQQIEQLTCRSSVERLADFLLKLSSGETGTAEIELPWDKALVAARLGMQPETLSRSLAKLRRLGIETRGSRVTVRDLGALRAFVAGGQAGKTSSRPHEPAAARSGIGR